MDQYLEFIARHPFLAAAAAALVGIIIAYEFNRATRGYRDLEAGDAPALINRENALLVDVRKPEEFEKSRALNAINLPLAEIGARIEELKADDDRPVVVYCGNGIDGGKAGRELVRHGIARVYNLKGGLTAWQAAGLPMKRGERLR